ncbi:MAG TPA: L-erythro-3,5-diaminohexanoate dehydrogenase [Candidatus Izemoplasmatales bacterium]|nr:L-erythro-3,5-diaminohexanoate dehydrogenase [Bacillota bacterium]HRY77375.1 L-erythro-3,5-diaminohexanoate dehydrogenase [Candidatus Izemoplasmatales bacterium]
MNTNQPCPYGSHRVITPLGALPQSADVIDNTMVCQDNEILIDVQTLNIDSASFTQIREACGSDPEAMKAMILSIVARRGKMQNPVTGSGGMLLGTIREVGKALTRDLKPGDSIATLVSLSLTPLKIDKILSLYMDKDQVDIRGQAILFETGIYAKIPTDLPADIVLSALDVAGAPAQVAKLVHQNDAVLIIGSGGKSGVLCAYQARKSAGPQGKIIGLIYDESERADLESLAVCSQIVQADARKPMEVFSRVMEASGGVKMDVTINVVNVPGTEMASILPTKDSGIVYFFGMATSFSRAALGAEGIKSEARMMIGNGYTAGHDRLTLDLLRESPVLRGLFQKRYGAEAK